MEKPRFRTVAEFLSDKGHKQRVSINQGKVGVKAEVIVWDPKDDQVLEDLMRKRTLAAIRKRLWWLFKQNGKNYKNESEKLD